jgi:hypothetical protein
MLRREQLNAHSMKQQTNPCVGLNMQYLFLLALCSISQAAPKPSTQPAELKLLPAILQQTAAPPIEKLTASRWICFSVRNILGAGYDTILAFTGKSAQDLIVTRTIHPVPGMNENHKPPMRDRVEPFAATLQGVILTFDNRPQTFALTAVGGKSHLILNAVVPTGEKQWYCALTQEPGPIIKEFLFDFADDPLTKDNGTGTLRLRVGDKPPVKVPINFLVTKGPGRSVKIDPQSSKHHQFQFAYLYFDDGPIGTIQDQDRNYSPVFEAEKKKP